MSSDPVLDTMLEPWIAGFDQTWTDVAGCALHWLIGGSGPPLLLLHGDYGSWTHWVRNLASLASAFRVYVVDLPGYGESATPAGDVTEHRIAQLLSGAVDQVLSPGASYRLAGFSFGGIVAGHLATQQADRVSHLVVCGPGGLGAPRADPLPTLERSTPGSSDASAVAVQRRNLARLMISDPEKADELAGRIHLDNIARTRVRAWDIPTTTTLLEAMPHIRAHLGAIWGGRDRYSTADTAPESERRMRQFHPDLRFEIIPGAGHWFPYENPGRFHALLLQMLRTGS